MLTVHFEDEGQDFLEWDIENGEVVACRPFQDWLWKGTKVHNTEIRPGDKLTITPRNWPGEVFSPKLIHPVERVTT